MKQNISLQIFIQPEVIYDFLQWKRKHCRRDRLLQSCGMCRHLLHLPSLDCGWRYRNLCIYLAFSIPSVHRIAPASLQAQNLFGTFILCFPCLADIPSTHRRSITSLCKAPAPPQSPPCEELCCAWWKAQGNEQLTNPKPTLSMPYLTCEWAQPLLTAAGWWKPSTLWADNGGWAKLVLERQKKELAEPPAFCWYPPSSKVPGLRSPTADIAQCCCDRCCQNLWGQFSLPNHDKIFK